MPLNLSIFLSVILYVCQAQCMLINMYVSVCVCVCECVRACGLLATWYTFLFVVLLLDVGLQDRGTNLLISSGREGCRPIAGSHTVWLPRQPPLLHQRRWATAVAKGDHFHSVRSTFHLQSLQQSHRPTYSKVL